MSLHNPACRENEIFIKSHQDIRAVNRFFDELKVVALFIGPSYGHKEAVISATRIWPRYFGRSSMPECLIHDMYASLEAVATEGVLYGMVPIKRQLNCCYPLGPALYELVAIAMYRRWLFRQDSCPIPFEYPLLIADRLPTGLDFYIAQCQIKGISC